MGEAANVVLLALRRLDLEDHHSQTELALRHSQDLYHGILDLTEARITRFDLDMRRTFVNEAYVKFTGEPPDRLLGGRMGQHLLPEYVQMRHRLFRQCVETRQPIRGIPGKWERDGKVYHSRANFEPILDEHGGVVGVQSTSMDVTELVETQEHLKLAIADRDYLYRITKEMLTVLDIDRLLGLICRSLRKGTGAAMVWVGLTEGSGGGVRPRASAGRGRSYTNAVVALHDPELGGDPAALAVRERRMVLVESIGSASPDAPWVHEAKKRRYTAAVAVPLAYREGVVGALSAYQQDGVPFDERKLTQVRMFADAAALAISNVRLLEQASSARALAELNEMKSQLLSTVSHELRTPLTYVKGHARMLLRYADRLSREEETEYLKAIDQACDRLNELIDHLIDMSGLESGALKIVKERRGDLRSLIARVAARMTVGLTKHQVVVDTPRSLPPVDIDGRRIEQVIENLIGNAIKYSPNGGLVEVRADVREDQIVISVADQGTGIPSRHLEAVFERFYRVQDKAGKQVPGAGLGLAICKGLVQAHEGRIWAESKMGKGSTFHFTLPRPSDDPLAKDCGGPTTNVVRPRAGGHDGYLPSEAHDPGGGRRDAYAAHGVQAAPVGRLQRNRRRGRPRGARSARERID
ncbi:MAG: ATP-binding protein [Chloroflexota bacterium]|nr:ATP-binding protein [Chloroflexota bacterium]